MNDQKYDWIIIGGGVSGISIAEILSREGKSVLIIEKNDQLASLTSKVFHEWFHTGALYSLVPDKLFTLRYLLGATDDLLKYYSKYENMNIQTSSSGLNFTKNQGWFNDEQIEYRYKVRKLNLIWMSMVSRSIHISNDIKSHDWLRKRAGSLYGGSKVELKHSFSHIKKQFLHNKEFFSTKSPDFTMNSRILLTDLLTKSLSNGLDIVTSESVIKIDKNSSGSIVKTDGGKYNSENVVICSPEVVSKLYKIPVKSSFAPIAVVEGVPDYERSFVELDYYPKHCINLLKKENGIGQAGGISVNNEDQIRPYLEYLINQHKKRNPSIKVIDDYVGIKKELILKNESRNYLYHINQHDTKVWSVVLGKFTLAFSMATEFYRRIYNANPTKILAPSKIKLNPGLLSKTSWQEIIENKVK